LNERVVPRTFWERHPLRDLAIRTVLLGVAVVVVFWLLRFGSIV